MAPPIFIGGIRRSGTSLLRAIIGSHPHVAFYPYDLSLFTYYHHKYNVVDLRDPCNASQFFEQVESAVDLKDPNPIVCMLEIRQSFYRLPQHEKSVGFALESILRNYAQAFKRPRFGLKIPYQEFVADEIFSQFPDARIVQIVRDPRDISASHAAYDHGAWVKKTYTDDALIRDWLDSSTIAARNLEKYPGHYLVSRYEDLVLNPKATVKLL